MRSPELGAHTAHGVSLIDGMVRRRQSLRLVVVMVEVISFADMHSLMRAAVFLILVRVAARVSGLLITSVSGCRLLFLPVVLDCTAAHRGPVPAGPVHHVRLDRESFATVP